MNEEYNCEHCGSLVKRSDDYCHECGYLSIDKVKCSIHPELNAVGVCVICMEPYCKNCMGSDNKIYLCCKHESYEIIEGYAKVHGTHIAVDAEYFKSVLENEGLHPFIFKRNPSPINVGYENHSIFRVSGEKPGFNVNEFKLMIPFQEVLRAEAIIKELKKEE